MGSKKLLFVFVLLLTSLGSWARREKVTLESKDGDWVEITYVIKQDNGEINISFNDVRKGLGSKYQEKYELKDVSVVFFERIGTYSGITFLGINPKAFMLPAGVKNTKRSNGYFFINRFTPSELTLELGSTDSTALSIPIYLAHYDKKGRYTIFSQCKDLVIILSKKRSSNSQVVTTSHLTTQTITSQVELEGMVADDKEIEEIIKDINGFLEEQEEYPFSNELQDAIRELREKRRLVPQNRPIYKEIEKVLSKCSEKEKQLKAEMKATAAAAEKEAELLAKRQQEEAQARQDSLNRVAQQKAEEESKRNRWLIIGGVIMAILAFVGNQAFQHYRNVKNQKSIYEMQANAVKHAQDEAKRRARSTIQSQSYQAQSNAKRKTRNIIHNRISQIWNKGKNNKRISI